MKVLLTFLLDDRRIRIRIHTSDSDPDPEEESRFFLLFLLDESRKYESSRIRVRLHYLDPRIRLRIHTKMSWIRNTALQILIFVFWHILPIFSSVFRIHDIFVGIRIRGSMPLTNGSGSGSCYFRHWPSRGQQKTNKKKVFLHITFWRYIYIIFKDKKSKRSHKTVGIKVFLTIFASW